ncbi:hypothetical protein HUN08_13490 [Gordonia sp. X0973]|uniref:hypothetical protein n=1 Tax=Gordonia sp. X0973 TaxID=2742602 RepID=UPI000FBF2149|nr:hypothetical protein [Gordonia sp. X0973]QKT08087.1 hypothetical protein HUN08_13490 [Gordonia sp. X0973]
MAVFPILPFGMAGGVSGRLKSVSEAVELSADAQTKLKSALVERLDDVSAVMRSVAQKYEHTDQTNAATIAQAYHAGLPEWKAPES